MSEGTTQGRRATGCRRWTYAPVVIAVATAAGCGRLGYDPRSEPQPGSDGGLDAGMAPDGGDAGMAPDGGDAGMAPDDGDAGALPGIAGAFTFDEGVEGWVPVDEETRPGFSDGEDASAPGVFDEWWTPPGPGGDRSLAVFRTAPAAFVAWRWTGINDGEQRIVGIRVRYGARIHFARFQGADPGADDYRVSTARVAWFQGELSEPLAVSEALTNVNVGPEDRGRWLSEEESERLGLVARDLAHDLGGLDVAPGEAVSIEWGLPVFGSSNDERYLTVGIDDLIMEPIFE